MRQTIAIVALYIFLVPLMQAQDKKSPIVALSEPALGERGTSRILYWNQEKDMALAAVTVDFGRPVWKKEYEDAGRFDFMTKGKVWRLGNDYWTILDSNVPIKIAGRDIPIGLWYLGWIVLLMVHAGALPSSIPSKLVALAMMASPWMWSPSISKCR